MESSKDVPRKENRYIGLKKCFCALVDRKQVNLDTEVLEMILKNELAISSNLQDKTLCSILPYMLIFYIKNWPGWQRSKEYYSGNLTYKDWFEKFRQYIVLRMNYLIKNGYKQAIQLIKGESKGSENVPLETNSLFGIGPYCITIHCPASDMTSIHASLSEEDVIIRSNPSNKLFNLTREQLFNMPFVSIEFESPELHFKRKNCGEYHRYLSQDYRVPLPKGDFIESIDFPKYPTQRICYTGKLLENYMHQYLSIAEKVYYPNVNGTIKSIFEAFIMDIRDIGMGNTMATNTSVTFNIGESVYYRTKMDEWKPEECKVLLHEIYVPKMETTLFDFKGVQDLSTPGITFHFLNCILLASSFDQIKAKITIRCEYCALVFDSESNALIHFQIQHGKENALRCHGCNEYFNIPFLAGHRWRHSCTKN